MAISSKALKLKSLGFTNQNTEDIWVLAVTSENKTYDWYCSSQKCCMIDKEFYSRKAKKMIKVNKIRIKILKYASTTENYDKCPDCGNTLFSLRSKT